MLPVCSRPSIVSAAARGFLHSRTFGASARRQPAAPDREAAGGTEPDGAVVKDPSAPRLAPVHADIVAGAFSANLPQDLISVISSASKTRGGAHFSKSCTLLPRPRPGGFFILTVADRFPTGISIRRRLPAVWVTNPDRRARGAAPLYTRKSQPAEWCCATSCTRTTGACWWNRARPTSCRFGHDFPPACRAHRALPGQGRLCSTSTGRDRSESAARSARSESGGYSSSTRPRRSPPWTSNGGFARQRSSTTLSRPPGGGAVIASSCGCATSGHDSSFRRHDTEEHKTRYS